ncbi:tyrosine/phenylalanine carboxypeptidase domain-containing protein [Pseudobacteriovorax antillogorgiicola]|uniref:Flavohemoglobin expression-modulating QEGLA motif protein n=1 Tax=Pseudobacteriovorax antillogorgiicola TaxID=1513793 RepID=A0A1Y6CQA4_9BACT|nr:tyrosine/phenylalanine carboxypeptidase domain-containing protein [Pseudobacteriovorax antillogorgiicola]TCS42751.1 uncharacterized protein (TIGR02421 family) [Pseudobacteriovorax antillogorgiicola]SMF82248.1 conserved hypothetical protein [Pseudobacteriovorax antillogorgiicola]
MIKREELQEINEQAVSLIQKVDLLASLTWPKQLEIDFLENWRTGNPKIPKPEYQAMSQDMTDIRDHLEKLLSRLPSDDPLSQVTEETIGSYIDAISLIEQRGTARFGDLSIEVYGRPGDKIPGTQVTNLDAAERFRRVADSFKHPFVEEPEECLPARVVAEELERGVASMGNLAPKILVVPDLVAKAAASPSQVKLRDQTCFNRYDGPQLLVHEVMTHSLTAINGQHQSVLKVLGRGSPRTTKTQEGLATFSEVITGAIDIQRLDRLALRVLATELALDGADFIDVFEFYLENGQTPQESYRSTVRLFRGGIPEGGSVFTKDSVYLDGLFKVFALFLWAFHKNRQSIIHTLFCGRVTIEDCFTLEEALLDGRLDQPKLLPEWYQSIESLAGKLAFSVLNTAINTDELETYFDSISR